jgi:hypothetical protein
LRRSDAVKRLDLATQRGHTPGAGVIQERRGTVTVRTAGVE